MWRSYFCLKHIIYLQSHLVVFRQIIQFFEFVKPVIKHTSGNSAIPFIISCYDGVNHCIDAIIHFGTNKNNRMPMHSMSQILIDLLKQIILCFILILLFNSFPFVDCDYDWPSLLYYISNQFKILNFESRVSIHNINYYIALLDMQHCADLCFFYILFLCFVKYVIV